MLLRKIALATLVGALSLSFVAAPSVAEAKRRRSKTRTLSFDDDKVEATFLRPEGTVTNSLSKKKRSSLIRIRMNFFAEIIRSARDL